MAQSLGTLYVDLKASTADFVSAMFEGVVHGQANGP